MLETLAVVTPKTARMVDRVFWSQPGPQERPLVTQEETRRLSSRLNESISSDSKVYLEVEAEPGTPGHRLVCLAKNSVMILNMGIPQKPEVYEEPYSLRLVAENDQLIAKVKVENKRQASFVVNGIIEQNQRGLETVLDLA